MNYISFPLVTLFILLHSFSVHSGDIKKWTDEKGRVYYGDRAPQSIDTTTIRTNKRPSNIGKPLPRLSTLKNANSSKKVDSEAAPETLEADQAIEACQAAKKDLAVIKKSSRIQLRSADGSLRYMTKEEINQRSILSKAEITKFCS